MKTKNYEIKYVAQRTGLSVHRIRAWERRYQAVTPERTATHRRLYSESDIRRLQLLRQAIDDGHRISKIGHLEGDDLMKLVNRSPISGPSSAAAVIGDGKHGQVELVQMAYRAVEDLDAHALETVLLRAQVSLPRRRLIEGLLVSLFDKIGKGWVQGTLGMTHEHMASAVVRSFLGANLRETAPTPGAAGIVVATLSGQRHELGAMSVALAAVDAGWSPLYLGPDLPAEAIAAAVEQTGAAVAAISMAFTVNSQQLIRETRKLDQLLNGRAAIVAGGQANADVRAALDDMGVRWCDTLEALHFVLLDENLVKREFKT